MAWNRRPVRKATKLVAGDKIGKFLEKDSNHNPPNTWQQWLRPTSLCEAIVYVLFNDRFEEGIPTTFSRAIIDPAFHENVAVSLGETCIYVGELYRRRIKDSFAPGGVRIEVAHKFFSPRCGPIIADPSFFKDAMADDVKDDGTV